MKTLDKKDQYRLMYVILRAIVKLSEGYDIQNTGSPRKSNGIKKLFAQLADGGEISIDSRESFDQSIDNFFKDYASGLDEIEGIPAWNIGLYYINSNSDIDLKEDDVEPLYRCAKNFITELSKYVPDIDKVISFDDCWKLYNSDDSDLSSDSTDYTKIYFNMINVLLPKLFIRVPYEKSGVISPMEHGSLIVNMFYEPLVTLVLTIINDSRIHNLISDIDHSNKIIRLH